MRQEAQLRVERSGTQWFVSDVHDRTTGVRVDAASVAAMRQGPNWVEGFVLAVHGLPLEVCQGFDQQLFNALGVAAHLKNFTVPAGVRCTRVQLTVEGEIQKQ